MTDARQAELQREIFLRSLAGNSVLGSVAKHLAAVMEEVEFAAGDIVYSAGGAPGILYFLVTGEVEISGGGVAPWRVNAPYLVGVIDAIHRRPHARTARALTPTHALTLRESLWFEALEDHFQAFHGMVRSFSADLHRIHRELAPGGGFAEPRAAESARGLLNVLECTLVLRGVPSLGGGSIQALAELAMAANEIALGAGDGLFTEGGTADSVFAIASGIVRVERRDPDMLVRFGAGSLVGGAAAIGLEVHPYTATAETAATVLEIRREHLFDVAEDHPEMIRALLAGLVGEQERVNDARAVRTSREPSAFRTSRETSG